MSNSELLASVAEALWDHGRKRHGLAPAPFPKERADFMDMAKTAIEAAQLDELRAALEACREKFVEYVELHRRKIGTKDASTPAKMDAVLEKIERNQAMVDLCDKALGGTDA
jgi:hypothetical protein